MTPHIRPLQLAVLAILQHATDYEWSVQGFGVLRLFIGKLGRLHIWDSSLRYPNVSIVHNHSWNLRSTVVSGQMTNHRYLESPGGPRGDDRDYLKQRLVTGYNTKMITEPTRVSLVMKRHDVMFPGDVYEQMAHEVHLSVPADQTITLMERHEDENGEADVYWPVTTTWGTAKPRPATHLEVQFVTAAARTQLTQLLEHIL